MEKAHLQKIPLVMAKLDVQKAFGSIKHKSVTAALVGIGVPELLVCAIMMEYCHASVRIELDGMKMCDVDLLRGVKQGSPLSAVLFAITTDYAHGQLVENGETRSWELRCGTI